MTDGETPQWGSPEDLSQLFYAIDDYSSVDWPYEDFDGTSLQLNRVLARAGMAIGATAPVYAFGAVSFAADPPLVSAHIFTDHTVVIFSGEATDPAIRILNQTPLSIAVTNAEVTNHRRRPGHLQFDVTFDWGTVQVDAMRRGVLGDAKSLLEHLRRRLGQI